MEPKKNGKRVLILQQRGWGRGIGHELAKGLAAQGYRLAAVTFKKSAHQFHIAQQDVHYDFLINNDAVLEDSAGYLAGDDYALEEITEALGIDSIWPLIFATRDIARSYSKKFYYADRQQFSDEQLVLYAKAIFKYIKKLFAEAPPGVLVAPVFTDLPHLMLYHYARRHGVPTVMVLDTKVQGMWTVVNDPFGQSGPFLDRIDELNAGAISKNAARAREHIAAFRAHYHQPDYMVTFMERSQKKPFDKRMRQHLSPLRRIWEFYAHLQVDRNPTVGPTIDWRPPHIILRDHYLSRRYGRAQDIFPYYDHSKLEKFVYFPLQMQPEATIDVLAPLFYNQLELARVLAISLPGDYTLAVKDHPSMYGLRSPEYLRTLAGTPNVKLVHFRAPHDELIQRSSLVVSLSGTSLAEAALYQKPAIQFGELGTTLKLPNVIKHSDYATLAAAIKKHMHVGASSPEYERRLENYVAAAFDIGTAIDYFATWEGDQRQRDLAVKMFMEGIEGALERAGRKI